MQTPLVITATPTLMKSDQSLDLAATVEHLTWLKEQGVNAVFAAGTTGEFPVLSDDERLQVLEATLGVFTADQVFFHVGAPSAYQAVELTKRAVQQGATKLAAVTPYYQPAPEPEVVDYYRQLVEAAGSAQVYAYLFEARTGTSSRPEILAQLAALGVAGVKISGESDESVAAYLAARPEGFAVYSGNDVSFGWLASAGGDGIVSGVSSVYPEPFIALREALAVDDDAAAQDSQHRIERVVAAVRAGSLTHLKAGVSARGFSAGPVRSAVSPAPREDVEHIAALIGELASV